MDSGVQLLVTAAVGVGLAILGSLFIAILMGLIIATVRTIRDEKKEREREKDEKKK